MKKKIILTATAIPAMIACTIYVTHGWVYLVTGLMFLAALEIIRRNKSGVTKMTRWAKANPKKSQVIITLLQIILMAMGIMAGYNYKELGYEFPRFMTFIFGTILVLSFLSVRFLPQKRTIALPGLVNRNRLAYLGITLSSFVLMTLYGNKMTDMHPNSPLTRAVRAIDQMIFSENSVAFATMDLNDENAEPGQLLDNETSLNGNPSPDMFVFASYPVPSNETIKLPVNAEKDSRAKLKMDKRLKKMEKRKARVMHFIERHRKAFAAGMDVGTVLLIVLLVILTCAGVCLIIAGFGGSPGLIPLGALLAGGSIWGIIKLGKKAK